MKPVNRTWSLTSKSMRKNGNRSNRPEEKLAYEIVKSHLISIVNDETQKTVWFDNIHHAVLDIYFTVKNNRYAFRIMGRSHIRNSKHDRNQKFQLEELGFIVIDIWWDEAINLFQRNTRLLTEPELKEAYEEIKLTFKEFGLQMKSYNETLIDQKT